MNQGSRWLRFMKKSEVENLVLLSLLVTNVFSRYTPESAISKILLLTKRRKQLQSFVYITLVNA
jgi:hypothetical protein